MRERKIRITILHIITGLSTGGAERSLVKLIEASDRSVFEHHVISLIDKGSQGELIQNAGVQVYELGVKKRGVSWGAIKRLRSLTRDLNPDIIHGWMYHGSLMALMSGSGKPKIMGIRHSLTSLRHEKAFTRLIIRILGLFSRKFSAIVYNAQVSKEQHLKYGFRHKNALVIPNGFNTKLFRPDTGFKKAIRQQLHIPESAFVFVNLARFHPMKNHQGLLRAFARVVQKHPETRLMLIGRGVEKGNEQLAVLIEQLGLENNVILLGERKDIPELLNASDAFVLPSAWGEGFPNVLGEAMACGLPCISTRVGDSETVVGDTGWLIPPASVQSLETAMLNTLSMSARELGTLGEKARQRILDNFQQQDFVRAHETLYKKLVE